MKEGAHIKKIKSKIITILTCATSILYAPLTQGIANAAAQPSAVNVNIDGVLQNYDQPAVIKDERTLVPLSQYI